MSLRVLALAVRYVFKAVLVVFLFEHCTLLNTERNRSIFNDTGLRPKQREIKINFSTVKILAVSYTHLTLPTKVNV